MIVLYVLYYGRGLTSIIRDTNDFLLCVCAVDELFTYFLCYVQKILWLCESSGFHLLAKMLDAARVQCALTMIEG